MKLMILIIVWITRLYLKIDFKEEKWNTNIIYLLCNVIECTALLWEVVVYGIGSVGVRVVISFITDKEPTKENIEKIKKLLESSEQEKSLNSYYTCVKFSRAEVVLENKEEKWLNKKKRSDLSENYPEEYLNTVMDNRKNLYFNKDNNKKKYEKLESLKKAMLNKMFV